MSSHREEANQVAFKRLVDADPVIVDIQRAGDVVPGMKPNMILLSGPPLPWDQYVGRPRRAALFAAVHEGLAATTDEADEKLRRGEIVVENTHNHDVAGSHTGVHTASMPVFVVEDRASGARGYCTPFEGNGPTRLTFGTYGEDSVERLRFVAEVLAPTLGEAIRRSGGIAVKPLIERAIQLGDEVHLITTAATMLFQRAVTPALVDLGRERRDEVQKCLEFLGRADHTFVRIALASCKATSNAASGVEGSSLVTVMAQTCAGFGIRVSGLGEEWICSPQQITLEEGKIENRAMLEDRGEWAADSFVIETMGLGAFVGAACSSMLYWLDSPASALVERTTSMYAITHGEHPTFRIPILKFRGAPCGIDLFKVLQTGVAPVVHGFLPTRTGVTAGIWRVPMEPFRKAAAAYEERYGR